MIGVGPFLSNVEAWLNGSLFLMPYAGIAGLGIAYMVVWAFLLGGIFDRFAHGEVSWTMERFFSASGRYFLRFLLLMVFSWIFYLLVLSMISPGLFGIIANATGDTTAERPVFFLTAGIYLVVALLLGFVNMVFDYAKIATVVNDHRNMFAAAWQGFRFVFPNLQNFRPVYHFGNRGAAFSRRLRLDCPWGSTGERFCDCSGVSRRAGLSYYQIDHAIGFARRADDIL
jgi:hypothetical protein